ncbi:MAG: MFS transporter [Candidatus Sericytochromatia bacterium]|nr:MAG: MFS transporter [Candidatus Sericytochromatia bacterium]
MRSVLNKFLAFKFFDDLMFIYPLYALMFKDNGLSIFEISLIFTFWSLTNLLMEIPSGILSDKFSRKSLIIIGQLLRILGYSSWIFFPNFYGFLLGVILWGIKSSFTNSSLSALIYDIMKKNNYQNNYINFNGKLKFVSLFAVVLSSLVADYIVKYGYKFILTLSIINLIISIIFIYKIKEEKYFSKEKLSINYIGHLKQGFKIMIYNTYLFKTIIFSSTVLATIITLDEFFPIFANTLGIEKNSLGLFLAFISLFQALANFMASNFKYYTDITYNFLYITGGLFLILVGFIFKMLPLSMIILLFFLFLFSVLDVIFEGKLHTQINSNIRATILSVKNFISEIMIMLSCMLYGISEKVSFGITFIILGLFIVLSGSIFLITYSKRTEFANKI